MISKIFNKIINRLKYNSSRVYLSKFLEQTSNEIPSGHLILDAGAGDGRYKEIFVNQIYESADIGKLERNYGNLTYQCNIKNIPVEDNKYDAIICTQVLEHIDEPQKALYEFHRILKEGGKLYLTAPLYYPEHEIPYDFFRYTQYGFQFMFNKAGLEIESTEWLEGYFMTLATQLWIGSGSLPLNYKKYGLGILGVILLPIMLLMKISFFISAMILSRLDQLYKLTTVGHCKNYVIKAKKIEKN